MEQLILVSGAPISFVAPLIPSADDDDRRLGFRAVFLFDAHQLTLAIYHVTATLPGEETYDLASQMRRAASSIPRSHPPG
jgi:hypothetical protein